MCFILALLGHRADLPLVLAANRDEMRARPSRAPFRWPREAIWAGRDEVAGGTWLGVNDRGLVAAVTNRRERTLDPSLPSRGRLCLGLLGRPSAEAAGLALADELAARRYNPFNLLCADARGGWVATWRGERSALEPGAHLITNRGELDDRSLPAVARAFELLDAIDTAAPLDDLLLALGRLCADVAGPDPICLLGGDRGTVSSSLIALDADGRLAAYWHADGPPAEAPYRPLVPAAVAR
ncbi:MAG TPA: NRDE family protein [Chloroflexota bacterium]